LADDWALDSSNVLLQAWRSESLEAQISRQEVSLFKLIRNRRIVCIERLDGAR
jgi:hypothetical protein